MWSPILQGMATLHELSTIYTLDDLVDMNTALVFKNQLDASHRPDDN